MLYPRLKQLAMFLPSLSKVKLLLVSSIAILAIIFTSSPAWSYSSLTDPTIQDYKRDVWEPAVYGTEEMNLESFTNESFLALIASIIDLFSHPINPAYQAQGSGDAILASATMIGLLYASPPASGIEYLADLGSKIGLAEPAFAQGPGVGFQALAPVRPVWTAFRNMAYLLFVIIFIVIGLAIMFRVRLNPQTVVGIQNAFPRLVIALLLVTFSYAIVGFIVDLIFILTFLVLAFFDAGGLINITAPILEPMPWGGGIRNDLINALITRGNVLALAFVIIVNSIGNLASGLTNLFGGTIGSIFLPDITPALPDIPGLRGAAGKMLEFSRDLVFGVVPSLIFMLVFLVVIFIVLIRLFWILLSSYIQIVLALIIAPFQLMLGALPAVETFGFGAWIRGLLANMIVFPATLALMLLAHILMGPTEWLNHPLPNLFNLNPNVGYTAGGTNILPPLIGTGYGAGAVQVLIGLGIMLMIPGILNRMKESIRGRVPPIGFGRLEQGVAQTMAVAPFRYGVPYAVHAPLYRWAGPEGRGVRGAAARFLVSAGESARLFPPGGKGETGRD